MTPNRTHGGPKMRYEVLAKKAGGVRGMVVGEKEHEKETRLLWQRAEAPEEEASQRPSAGSERIVRTGKLYPGADSSVLYMDAYQRWVEPGAHV